MDLFHPSALLWVRNVLGTEQIQEHLHGVWNISQLALDMDTLHPQIRAISHSRLKTSSGELANYDSSSIINFVKHTFLWSFLIIWELF